MAGSFLLTPATAMRYEKHDRKVRAMNETEALGLGVGAQEDGQNGSSRKKSSNPRARTVGSDKDEYYVRIPVALRIPVSCFLLLMLAGGSLC